MADSRRKPDAKKSQSKVAAPEAEELRNRLERMTLLLYLEGAVAIVVGMIVLSEFLSQGKPSQNVLIAAGVLFGILAIGVAFTWMARRKAGGKSA